MGLYNVLLLVFQGGIFNVHTKFQSKNLLHVSYFKKTLGEDRCIEGFGRETQGNETIWETYA